MQDDVAECIKKDYVAVVGTSEYFAFFSGQTGRAALNNISGLDDIFSGGMMGPGSGDGYVRRGIETMERNSDYANKMMFAAQAVRGLQINSAGADFKTLIYFTAGYTSAQLAAIQTAGAAHASPGRTFAINSTDALITKLNEASFPGDSCSRRIWRMDLYSHGVPDDLAFGYNGRNAGARSFTASHASRLDRERYDNHGTPGRIYSWACRTAISGSGAHGGLAQSMANATRATVYAYARRTEYTNTWNTGGQTAAQAGLTEIAGSGSRVLWHPDGARRGVIEGTSPAGNRSGQFSFTSQ